MIITFCGHSDFSDNENIKNKLIIELNKLPKNTMIEFYLGGYGNFDYFAKSVCLEFKKTRNNVKLFYITPYLTPSYLRNKQHSLVGYDQILSFEHTKKCGKFSILKRNESMIKSADIVFAYVNRTFGGAYKSLKLAKHLKKQIIDLTQQPTCS